MKGGTVPTVYVVAKSKTVAERNGEIALDFIIGIPATLQNNTWGLSLTPVVENNGTEEALQPLSIRGELFSEAQKRQYWQMNKYLNRILGDTTGLSSTVSLAAKYYEAYNRYLGNNKKRLAEKLETTYKETSLHSPIYPIHVSIRCCFEKANSGIIIRNVIGRPKIRIGYTSIFGDTSMQSTAANTPWPTAIR